MGRAGVHPGEHGAAHCSKLVRVWPPGAHEKGDERDDAWGAVAASVEEGDGDDGSPEESDVSDDGGDEGDDGAGGDGELELVLDAVIAGEEPAPEDAGDAVAAGVEEAVVDLDVGSGDAPLGGGGDVPPVPDTVALPAVPAPGAAPRGPRRAPPTAAATIPGGRMCYYEMYGRFTAECGN